MSVLLPSGSVGRAEAAISEYAFLGDGHGAALVSAEGSVDWCSLVRFDAGPVFAALLDAQRGGRFALAAPVPGRRRRRYLPDTLVLETTVEQPRGTVVVTDCLVIDPTTGPVRRLARTARCSHGMAELDVLIAARFDHGAVRPWLRRHGAGVWSAIGGSDALLVATDAELQRDGDHDLRARLRLPTGATARFVVQWSPPEHLDGLVADPPDVGHVDDLIAATVSWWRRWAGTIDARITDPAVRRSALVLKGLTYAPTGAVVAAPTTSLPEAIGGERNWDYRFSWVRDSQFTVRSLAVVGCEAEADAFRRFIERSAAGHADELQIMYGVGGERRLTEVDLPHLHGYRGSRPVRIGNAAAGQRQLDVYGYLADLSWQWHRRGRSPEPDFWEFLVSLVDAAAQHWESPDRGTWEVRGAPQHYVHSKAMCWVALDRGVRLAQELRRSAPIGRWVRTRDAIAAAVNTDGYDAGRRTYRRSFGSDDVDAALLLLPMFGFVGSDDPRMVGTADTVRHELDDHGLLRRYRGGDGMDAGEGVFIACSFWLVEVLAQQGRLSEARAVFRRARQAANDLGLFSEELDPITGEALGNFPQGLSHLSHIGAALALASPRSGAGVSPPSC